MNEHLVMVAKPESGQVIFAIYLVHVRPPKKMALIILFSMIKQFNEVVKYHHFKMDSL